MKWNGKVLLLFITCIILQSCYPEDVLDFKADESFKIESLEHFQTNVIPVESKKIKYAEDPFVVVFKDYTLQFEAFSFVDKISKEPIKGLIDLKFKACDKSSQLILHDLPSVTFDGEKLIQLGQFHIEGFQGDRAIGLNDGKKIKVYWSTERQVNDISMLYSFKQINLPKKRGWISESVAFNSLEYKTWDFNFQNQTYQGKGYTFFSHDQWTSLGSFASEIYQDATTANLSINFTNFYYENGKKIDLKTSFTPKNTNVYLVNQSKNIVDKIRMDNLEWIPIPVFKDDNYTLVVLSIIDNQMFYYDQSFTTTTDITKTLSPFPMEAEQVIQTVNKL